MKKEILATIAMAGIIGTNHNTNNGWGFGGAIKTVYELPEGYSVHDGTAYYRHAKPEKFINLRKNGCILTEVPKEILREVTKLLKQPKI